MIVESLRRAVMCRKCISDWKIRYGMFVVGVGLAEDPDGRARWYSQIEIVDQNIQKNNRESEEQG